MNSSNSKKNEKNYSSSQKDLQLGEFNQKLDSIILDIQSKEKTFKSNLDLIKEDKRSLEEKDLQKKMNCITETNNILSEETIKNDNRYNLLKIRSNFKSLMGSDMFANNYDLTPSTEIFERMNDYNNNFQFDLPYCQMFKDHNLLKDESIFMVFDDEYQDKYIDKEDIKKIKTENIELNFGKDPYEIYGLIQEGKINTNDKQSIEFFNSLKSFNIFKSKNPNYINFDINMKNDNNFYNVVGKDKYVVVKFFTKWCMYCKMMAPEYEKFYELYLKKRDDVLIKKIECSNKKVCIDYGIFAFPFVGLFFPGSTKLKSVFKYKRTYEFFDKWITLVAPKKNLKSNKKVEKEDLDDSLSGGNMTEIEDYITKQFSNVKKDLKNVIKYIDEITDNGKKEINLGNNNEDNDDEDIIEIKITPFLIVKIIAFFFLLRIEIGRAHV